MEPTNTDPKDQTIEKLREQNEEYLNGWKRAKADLINFQNDAAKERIGWAKFATAGSLLRLLPALDTLYAAHEHFPEFAETVKKFEEYLKGEDMIEIECDGKYDPLLHEVIGMEKQEGAEPGTIIKVAQRGYKLHDQVLRPAKVIVAE
jgi:Molecular chaperone GrpE (heat shock protein)